MPIEWKKINKIGLGGLWAGFGIIVNIFALKSPILGLILSVFWLGSLVYNLKTGWLDKEPDGSWAKAVAFLTAGMIILGSLFFYLLDLSDSAVAVVVLILSVGGWQGSRKNNHDFKLAIGQLGIKASGYVALYFIFYIASWVLLFTHRSAEAIRTPFEVLPKTFLLIYFALSASLILFLTRPDETVPSGWKKFLLGAHFLLSLSIATVIYKIGFGFDPFVHRAAEKALLQLGYIEPKPLYYVGQYSLVALGAKILQASVAWVDKLLVPILAVLTLPGLLLATVKKIAGRARSIYSTVALATVVITPLFFYTVPQSLANCLLLILILISYQAIGAGEKISLGPWLILVAIFFIHPLSAIPGAIWLVFWTIAKWPKLLRVIYFLVASASIPTMFFISQKMSSNFGLELAFKNLARLTTSLRGDIFNYLPFYSIYHLIYLYRTNILLVFLLILTVGAFYAVRTGTAKKTISNYLMVLGVMTVNLFLMALINFRAIIDYEQVEFIRRLMQIILIMSIPLLAAGIYLGGERIGRLKYGRAISILGGALLLTMTLYLSYPRDDAFNKGRSYAVARTDLKAVEWVDNNARGQDYVALANQSVAAAALQEFGFKKYYISNQKSVIRNQELFYYPIPTSSPLYEIYLDIIYNGVTLEKIQKARELTGASKVYLVINSYWLDAKKRVAEAKLLTDNFQEIEGRVWVFGW